MTRPREDDAAAPDAAPQTPWRIVLADDHAMVRAGLVALLDDDPRCQVVGEAGTLGQLRALAATEHPDLVLLDVTLGAEDGLDALPELRALHPAPKIVVLTMHDDPAFAREALSRGADGYLVKEAAAGELVQAIKVVMAGAEYLHPALGARMARRVADSADSLTQREREVLRLLALGHTNAEIAAELFVSLRTVEAHRAALRDRLGATTRADLVDAAHRLSLLDRSGP